MTTVYSDADGLSNAAGGLRETAQYVAQTIENFANRVYVPGEPGCPYSDSLRVWLGPATRGVVAAGSGMGDAVGGLADGVTAMREAYRAADAAAAR